MRGTAEMAGDELYILSTDLLHQERALAEEFLGLSKRLGIPLGWHYLLDLPWAARQLSDLNPGAKVLDAGAGHGLMQWWLSDHQMDVISVDRVARENLPRRLRSHYPVRGMRAHDLLPPPPRGWRERLNLVRSAFRSLRDTRRARRGREGKGTVTLYHQDLGHMPEIPDASMDAIVSISSLEHNTPEGLRACLVELLRVLKPGGRLVATLGAAKSSDWFHEPSKGWCYTEPTLRRIFGLPEYTPSNYDRYEELMSQLRECAQLRNELAAVYYQGGNNGMPWGRWDPQYQPVGIVKIKTAMPFRDVPCHVQA